MSDARPRIGVDATVFEARPSGARRRFVELYRRLVEGDDRADYRFYAARGERLEEFAPFAAGRTSQSPLSPGRPIGRLVRGLLWWPTHAARDELRLLHMHALPVPDLLARTKIVLTVHDLRALALPALYSRMRAKLQAMALESARHRVARFVTVSEFTRRELLSRIRIDESRVVVIPNAPSDVAASDPRELRARLGLPGRFVLAVAHLEPRKNLAILIEAMKSVRDENIVIVGEGPERAALLARARLLGVEARVRIVPPVGEADLVALYRMASVFLFPSLYEGFGIPLVEAMAAGTPVIAAATSAIPEVAGDAALLLGPHDAGAWSEAIRSLLHSDLRRQAFIQAGRERAARFSWDRSAAELLALERQLL